MNIGRSFSELAQEAEQLTTHMGGGGEDLPRVDRSISQILHTGDSLWVRPTTHSSTAQDAQASILLGSRGLDLPYISNKLESLTAGRTLEPLTPVADTDLDTFLTNERQNAIITAIEDAKRQTSAEVERLFWRQQKAEWEQAKQNLLSAFTHSSSDLLNITVQIQDSLVGTTRSIDGGSSLSSEETIYVRVIKDYNIEVLQGGIRPNLAEILASAASVPGDQGVKDLWSLMRAITEIPVSIGGDVVKARAEPRVQTAIVKQARKHLERSYESHMRNMVYAQLELAQLGGMPGMLPLVQAYLNVILLPQMHHHLEDGLAQKSPVWPLIFFCLRAGGAKAACAAAADNNNPAVAEVVIALKQLEKTDCCKVLPDTEKKLRLAYKRCNKSITDPFKRAVYCILSRSDPLEDHSDIITTTDDYMWLKLCMVDCEASSGNYNTSMSGGGGSTSASSKCDHLTLTHFQNMLYHEYGETHFNAWQQPLLYTSVLLLTGQFEAAIEFLSRVEKLRCHAVHIALALHEMNLLALPVHVNAPMLSRQDNDPECTKRLNLTRLIMLFTRKFESSDPCEALHYYYFLRTLKDKNKESVFTGCISELVLQSREFDLLLGKLNLDGSRTPGIIDKFKVDVSEVTELVARDSEKKGLHEDAIKLYDLAKNHERVLCLLNQLLGQVVHQPSSSSGSGSGSKRDRVIGLGSAIALRFKTYGNNASPSSGATLHLLLDLATFFELHQQERFNDALQVLKQLDIIALTRNEVDTRVTNLTSLGTEIRSVLPHVLLAAMTATHRLYRSPDAAPQQSLNTSALNVSIQTSPAPKHLREQARAIVTFAGMIPLRLHADVNARLVQLEALIN